jgi:hypothetical protein
MENTEAQVASTEGIGGAAPAAAQPELSISDLQNLRALVETAVRRGAFQANEMTAVGAVFDRVNNFLTAIAPKEEAPAADATAEEAVAE